MGQYFVLHTVGRADPAPTAIVDALFFYCTLTTLAYSNPRGTNFIGASRDLLLLVLLMLELRYHVFIDNTRL